MLRIAATSLAVVVTASLVAGCGGIGHSAGEARLATLANGVCREADSIGAYGGMKVRLAKLDAQLNSDRELPRVATYLADAQASASLRATLSKLSYKEYAPAASPLLKESSRLERKLQSDAKALGWTACAGTGLQ